MSFMAKVALLFVVFVDLISQGLVFPIVNVLIMDPTTNFLAFDTPDSIRHVNYGLVIGLFFLAWFVGVIYLSKASDSIGRKFALQICLAGALIGYTITIISLYVGSLWLLILGRMITGFSAGNQAVAQAAMVDASENEIDRDRNMGYIILGVSFGLVGGPIIGAALSGQQFIGHYASFTLPFYATVVLVLIAMGLVAFFYHDVREDREPFRFHAKDLYSGLVRVKDFPLVMRILPVFICFMIANQTFFVFVVNYLTSAFGYGEVGGSFAMLVVGVALAISSGLLVKPAQSLFGRKRLVCTMLTIMALSVFTFALVPTAILSMFPLFLYFFCFGVTYPTILGFFSGSVGEADQGWVMGISTSILCLTAGVMALIGGGLMSIDIQLPFFIAAASVLFAFLLILTTWNQPALKKVIGVTTK
ncbi:MFS transporter [Pseudovibrio japonicus]|uniref:MFS transporter n=1 Tax=Pseudovibrio japonicus TaxID=366534 RepID=A0ABQ3E4E0_9HYPH|nr:MFS transporter [Pseudovibrio japonicus]GHB25577.1 MFS transporter [Pseudovibrio japonicus]